MKRKIKVPTGRSGKRRRLNIKVTNKHLIKNIQSNTNKNPKSSISQHEKIS